MRKNAFLFPGQASQYVGMGKELYEQFPTVRELYGQANDLIGFNLSEICFNGPEDKLKQTKITQPAIFVHSVAVFEILKSHGIQADAAAGHSLGEYSALVAAGAFTFEDGFNLVKIRGELMQQAGTESPGTMAAIIGLDPDQVYEVCDETTGIVCPANFNSPGQIAISGEIDAVRKAMELARQKGAKKVVELVVSGAFHSPLMSAAQQGLSEALQRITIHDPNIPVYSNVEALPVSGSVHIREMLNKQLLSPVRWTEIIQNMHGDGFESFAEIGPGKVLCGLNKRINRDLVCTSVDTVANIEEFLS